jgi:hypothetical protein
MSATPKGFEEIQDKPASPPPPPPKGKYGKGYIPDTHDKSKDLKARALLGAVLSAAQIPPDASIENFIDTIRDQLQTSCCTGFAFAMAIFLRLRIVLTPIPWPSVVCLYTLGRLIGGEKTLTDDGAQPYAVVEGAQEWGTASSYNWGFDPAKINEQPNLEELENASALEIQQFYRVDEEGAARVQRVCQAIHAGYPVIIGTMVDQAMEDYDGKPTSIVDAPDPSQLLGGHMLCIVGYRTVIDPKTKISSIQFRVANSWGVKWGDKGLFWATQAWMESTYMTDVYLLECNALPQPPV